MHEGVVQVVAVLHLAFQDLTPVPPSSAKVHKTLDTQDSLQWDQRRQRGVVTGPPLEEGKAADRVPCWGAAGC